MARYQGQVDDLPRHRAAGRADSRLHVRAEDRRRQVHAGQVAAARHRALGAVHRRAVRPPRRISTSPARCRRRSRSRTSSADKDADKRDKLIDRLLDTPEYSYYFANKWADILRVKRGNNSRTGLTARSASTTGSARRWRRDKPYDEFARDILAAVGDETKCPPTVWYKDMQTADQFVDNASQVFLGMRMQCAQCHHHPYEKWSQDDYWGLAAFYGRVGTQDRAGARHRRAEPAEPAAASSTPSATATCINKRTGKARP